MYIYVHVHIIPCVVVAGTRWPWAVGDAMRVVVGDARTVVETANASVQ